MPRKKSKRWTHDKIRAVMHEFKHRKLHSGSKNGPLVKNRRQAVAIALAEQSRANERRRKQRAARKRVEKRKKAK